MYMNISDSSQTEQNILGPYYIVIAEERAEEQDTLNERGNAGGYAPIPIQTAWVSCQSSIQCHKMYESNKRTFLFMTLPGLRYPYSNNTIQYISDILVQYIII